MEGPILVLCTKVYSNQHQEWVVKMLLYKVHFLRVTWKIHLTSKLPHICALDARKYATHLRKFWRQFPSSSYKKWTLTWIGWLLHHFHRKFACPWNFFKMYSFLLHCVSQTRSSWVAALGNWIITSTIQ